MVELNWKASDIELMDGLTSIIFWVLIELGMITLLIGLVKKQGGRKQFYFSAVVLMLAGCAWWMGGHVATAIEQIEDLTLYDLSASISMIPIALGLMLWNGRKRSFKNSFGCTIFWMGTAQYVAELVTRGILKSWG